MANGHLYGQENGIQAIENDGRIFFRNAEGKLFHTFTITGGYFPEDGGESTKIFCKNHEDFAIDSLTEAIENHGLFIASVNFDDAPKSLNVPAAGEIGNLAKKWLHVAAESKAMSKFFTASLREKINASKQAKTTRFIKETDDDLLMDAIAANPELLAKLAARFAATVQ